MELRAPATLAFAFVLAGSALVAYAPGHQSRRAGWPCGGGVDPSYISSAETTGGKVMLLDPSEPGASVADMSASRQHEETVFRAVGEVPQGEYEFEMPLDSTIESAYFFVSMQCLEGVSIIPPSGDELRADTAGVERQRFKAIHLYTVAAPDPGGWKVRVAGRGFFSVIAQAKTDLRLRDVAFFDGDVRLDGPRVGVPQRLEACVSGTAEDIAFQLISPDGSPIESLDLSLEGDGDFERTYAGEVTPTSAEFRVSLTGRDANGFRFQRVLERLLVGR